MTIRKAQLSDIPKILDLLSQVLEVHAKIRPDIFVSGTRKYNAEQLEAILCDETRHVYVAENQDGNVVGHIFFEIKKQPGSSTRQFNTLFVEDLCVDENARRQRVGEGLFEFAKEEARRLDCRAIALAVWEGNTPAQNFYNKMGMHTKLSQMEYILD